VAPSEGDRGFGGGRKAGAYSAAVMLLATANSVPTSGSRVRAPYDEPGVTSVRPVFGLTEDVRVHSLAPDRTYRENQVPSKTASIGSSSNVGGC